MAMELATALRVLLVFCALAAPIPYFVTWATGVLVASMVLEPKVLYTIAGKVGISCAALVCLLQMGWYFQDLFWPLEGIVNSVPPSSQSLSIYVASRNFPEYPDLLKSIRQSWTPGLPKLDLVLLDVGSEIPLRVNFTVAREERLDPRNFATAVPIFQVWEYIAATATSEQVIYFDENVLLPSGFDWQRYLSGRWFFGKQYEGSSIRTYSACFSVPRAVLASFVRRLRGTPHLYRSWSNWGGVEDQLAILDMGTEKAPQELVYHKFESTALFGRRIVESLWTNPLEYFNRYLLIWSREGRPSESYCQFVQGPACYQLISTFLGGYGVYAVADTLLFLAGLLPPEGRLAKLVHRAVPSAIISVVSGFVAVAGLVLTLVALLTVLEWFSRAISRRMHGPLASKPEYGAVEEAAVTSNDV